MKITNLILCIVEYELRFLNDKGEETYASFLTDEETRFNVFKIGVGGNEFNKYKKRIVNYLYNNFKRLKKQYNCKKQKQYNFFIKEEIK